jgi:hypothetical protein
MLFLNGRRGDSLSADALAAVIGWIEVALLSLRIVEVSADTLVKARSSILGAIWAPERLNLLGIELGANKTQKKKDSDC